MLTSGMNSIIISAASKHAVFPDGDPASADILDQGWPTTTHRWVTQVAKASPVGLNCVYTYKKSGEGN
jgi:hypothetical protein